MHINNRSMTVYRKQESMNERPVGIKSRYTNIRNIDNLTIKSQFKLNHDLILHTCGSERMHKVVCLLILLNNVCIVTLFWWPHCDDVVSVCSCSCAVWFTWSWPSVKKMLNIYQLQRKMSKRFCSYPLVIGRIFKAFLVLFLMAFISAFCSVPSCCLVTFYLHVLLLCSVAQMNDDDVFDDWGQLMIHSLMWRFHDLCRLH